MKQDMTTKELLMEWGLWLHHCEGLGLGYTSPALDMLRSNTGRCRVPDLPRHNIEEKLASTVDQLVATLTIHDESKGKALAMYYGDREGVRDIANELKITRTKANQILHEAVAWIDGARHGKF
jgi:hypothetical protein